MTAHEAPHDTCSVNDVWDTLYELVGCEVHVRGLFHFRLEDVTLHHWPRVEQRTYLVEPSLWVGLADGPYDFNDTVLARWDMSRVVVSGRLRVPDPEVGAGHAGLWHAEIRATRIGLWKDWQRHH